MDLGSANQCVTYLPAFHVIVTVGEGTNVLDFFLLTFHGKPLKAGSFNLQNLGKNTKFP